MDLGLDFEGWAPHGWIAEGRTIPRGVIVPHRNRTRVWGGLRCAFYNGYCPLEKGSGRLGDPPLPFRRQDGGVPSQAATSAAPPATGKMPVVPVGGRGATALPVGVLPRTRGRSPYTAKRLFSARYFINCASSAKSAREV